MRVCSVIPLFVVAAAVCNIGPASALRGSALPASDLHESETEARRKLKKGSSKEPYQLVSAHKGGLFGSVPKVAKKAKDKQDQIQEQTTIAAIQANSTANLTLVAEATGKFWHVFDIMEAFFWGDFCLLTLYFVYFNNSE